MLIELALGLATATIALPPMTLSVQSGPGLSPIVVRQTMEEAAAIWRTSGVTLLFEGDDCASGPVQVVPSVRIQVTFEDKPTAPARIDALPLGWIDFDDQGDPMRQIHLSPKNATLLMANAEGDGRMNRMTTFERNLLLSRTLGRALAHELGHYLLSSKSHTKTGLMKAHRVAADFLGPSRDAFEIEADQRSLVAARLWQAPERVTVPQD